MVANSKRAALFAPSGLARDLIIGGAIALAVAGLGWLDVANAPTSEAADTSIREFGTLLTVLFGAILPPLNLLLSTTLSCTSSISRVVLVSSPGVGGSCGEYGFTLRAW